MKRICLIISVVALTGVWSACNGNSEANNSDTADTTNQHLDVNTGVPLNNLRRSDTTDTSAKRMQESTGVPLDNIHRDRTDDTVKAQVAPRTAK